MDVDSFDDVDDDGSSCSILEITVPVFVSLPFLLLLTIIVSFDRWLLLLLLLLISLKLMMIDSEVKKGKTLDTDVEGGKWVHYNCRTRYFGKD